jgi:hypothetical protein
MGQITAMVDDFRIALRSLGIVDDVIGIAIERVQAMAEDRESRAFHESREARKHPCEHWPLCFCEDGCEAAFPRERGDD